MTPHRASVAAWLAACLCIAPLLRAADSAAPDRPAREAMAWLDTVGFPDLKGAQFVRITMPDFSEVDFPGEAAKKGYSYRFVVKSGKGTIDTFPTGIAGIFPSDARYGDDDQALEITPYPWVGQKLSDAHALDLRAAAEALLKNLQHPSKMAKMDPSSYLDQRAAVFIFAWALRRNGLDDLSDKLVAQAGLLAGNALNEQPSKEPWRPLLEREISKVLIAQATAKFNDTAISRPELLAEFEGILDHYPQTPFKESLQKTIAELKVMIAEDRNHAKKPPGQLPEQARVAELIYELRDQRCAESGQINGQASVLPAKKGSPAEQLHAMGPRAEPWLKQAENDGHFTRIVTGMETNLKVVTVGQCAEMIMAGIIHDPNYKAL